MKYIFQIPIFLLMLWASGVSYATHSVALSDGKIDAYVKNACSDGSATGAISDRHELINSKCMGSKSQTSTIGSLQD